MGQSGHDDRRSVWQSAGVYQRDLSLKRKAPHPSPLPEGEGTDPGMLERYTDLNLLGRIHSRLDHSGRCIASATSVGPLSLGRGLG
ncbi:hypothetical protein EMIT0347P_110021 [Pseudomonas sp. IT-347P]